MQFLTVLLGRITRLREMWNWSKILTTCKVSLIKDKDLFIGKYYLWQLGSIISDNLGNWFSINATFTCKKCAQDCSIGNSFIKKKIPHTKLALHMHFVLILFITYTPGTIRLKKKVRTISKNCDNDNFIDRSLIGDTVSYKEVNVWSMYRGS